MAGITTSIVISFVDPDQAAEANAILTAEVDSREDGLNEGNTQFTYGDSPAYLVYRTSNVSYTQTPTDGSIAVEVNGATDTDEVIQFIDSDSSSLSKPPTGGVTFAVLAGAIDLSKLSVVGTTVNYSGGKVLGVVRATYSSNYEAYRLQGVVRPVAAEGLDSYPVIIYLLGTVT